VSAQQSSELLARLRGQGVNPAGITADSRKVASGELFAAWPGFKTDGRRHIGEAVTRGAAAVLWESGDGYRAESIPVPALGVEGLRALSGHLAHEIYGRPSSTLWMTGVTGTNGKTTVTQWLASGFEMLQIRCGVIGTLGWGYAGKLSDLGNTTPDALVLHRLLREFVDSGASAVAMEVSSIGLEQGRVSGVEFDVAVYTNLTRDHLDYHGSMERYGASKARLFETPGLRTAVVNLDDMFGVNLARRLVKSGLEVIGCTHARSNADAVPGARALVAQGLQPSQMGQRFSVSWEGRTHDLQARVLAPFNVSNLLAVIGVLLSRGVELEDALTVASRLVPPEGRMQLVGGVGEPLVVIDYAHSPDALGKVLQAVRATAEARRGRLVCVFGCGGDRDPGKRPLMGEVARQFADHVILTSDNPRSEDPRAIIDAIQAGAGPAAVTVVDRAQAIRIAIGESGANDVVVLAGKGHEPYQEVLGQRLPFCDIEHARAALLSWNPARGDDR